ncbi:hypothetical protein FFJ24_010050 [Pedobacter sp. KBS0701]|uniref:hypothetical protein n=1 Tax=Pedobacter sp. KBS0701 TaxID=2578106 RepID=UPI00110DE738|nr:hypothetical protein [Pedobacter sp. KBS0701]QDW25134.1 hypothetical protein FFJ24_010050 [Pedobacter sp. KBS0701]
MKTTVINAGAIANNGSVDHKANGLAGGGAAATASTGGSAIMPNMDFDKSPESVKTEVKGGGGAKAETLKAKLDAEKGKAEVADKTEGKMPAGELKPVRNLDSTIKLALDLTRRINQRGKLLETIGTLEAFEVAQQDNAEETDVNFYQGCTLTIEDDNGREFSTKNPFIIKAVAADVNRLCVDKLAEIESEIFIPA